MTRLISYDAAGEGAYIADSGSIDVGSADDTELVSSLYLGNNTYLETYSVDNVENVDRYQIVTFQSRGQVFLRAVTYYFDDRKALEISQANVSATDLAIDGTASLFRLNDYLRGSSFRDVMNGFGGNDTLFGHSGSDKLLGSAGSDKIYGGDGSDSLLGQIGNDLLFGDDGIDNVDGGAGLDRIVGGKGADVLTGGGGRDVFVFYQADGRDRVSDFMNGVDKIEVASGAEDFEDLRISQRADDVIVRFSNTTVVILEVSRSDLGASDFEF